MRMWSHDHQSGGCDDVLLIEGLYMLYECDDDDERLASHNTNDLMGQSFT